MQTMTILTASVAALLLAAAPVAAEDVLIESFDANGQLTFNEITNATEYRVEWMSGPGGEWTNTWDELNGVPAGGGGTVTVSVPMVYRVVATVTDPPTFSLIPAGTFIMGSPATELGSFSDETKHQVTLTRDYFMQKTEVTNRQMADVLNWALGQGLISVTSATVRNTEGDQQELLDLDDFHCQVSWNGAQFGIDAGKDDYPCIEVTWYGAQAYCNYLSDMEGLDLAVAFSDWSINLAANGYRLPTESEWEYACRAGTTTALYTGDLTYTGGFNVDPNLDVAGWYWSNSTNPDNPISGGRGTHPVGQKQANAWGLFDMHGNVFEFCADRYDAVYPGTVTDPTGPSSGTSRVARGGDWFNFEEICRSANRGGPLDPANSTFRTGFRPVRSSVP